jgi:CBS domain-containing protein
MLPRALERLALIEAEAPVRETARDVTYCRTQEILLDVWSIMRERGLQRVPILDEARRPLGIIYAREALQALLSESEGNEELLHDYISGVGYR